MNKLITLSDKLNFGKIYRSQSFFGIIYRFYTLGLVFLSSWIIGRYLGPEKLGEYSIIQATFLLFQTFMIGGSDTLVALDFSLSNYHSDSLKNSIIVRLVLFISSIFILLAFKLISLNYVPIILLFLLVQVFNYVESFYYSKGDIFSFLKLWIFITAPLFVLKLCFVYLTRDLSYKFYSDSIEVIILLIIFYLIHKKRINLFDLFKSNTIDNFKIFVTNWFPLWLNAVFLILYTRVDQFFIHKYFGNFSLGVYSATLQITSLILIPISAISIQSFPQLVKIQSQDQSKFEKKVSDLTIKLVLVTFLWFLILLFFGLKMFHFIYGSKYNFDLSSILIISFGIMFNATGMIAGQVAVINKSFWLPISRSIIGLFISILSSLTLLPLLSIRGAAIGFFLTSFVTNFLSYLFFKQGRIVFKMQTSWIPTLIYGFRT